MLDVHEHSCFCMQELHSKENFALLLQHSGGYWQILAAQPEVLRSPCVVVCHLFAGLYNEKCNGKIK